MSRYDELYDDTSRKYALETIAQAEWMLIGDALKRLSTHLSIGDAKRLLVDRLSRGLLKSYAWRISHEWAEYDSEEHVPSAAIEIAKGALRDYLYATDRGSHAFDDVILERGFWSSSFASASAEWTGKVAIFDPAYLADWERSEFAVIADDASEVRKLEYDHAIGVSVELRPIELLAPLQETHLDQERSFRYDWLGAFAHVAAILRDDDVLPDIYKHGAQAEIADWLANWFVEQTGQQPSPKPLKEKAKIILQALKRKDTSR